MLSELTKDLTKTLEPLLKALRDPAAFRILMYRLGWALDTPPPSWAELAPLIEDALSAAEGVAADPGVSEVAHVLQKVEAVHAAVRALDEVPAGVDASFADEIPERLFELLLLDMLASSWPRMSEFLVAVGVVRTEWLAPTVTRPAFVLRHFAPDELVRLVEHPAELGERVYQWAAADFAYTALVGQLFELFVSAGIKARLQKVEAADLDRYSSVDVFVDPARVALWVPFLESVLDDIELRLGLLLLSVEGDESALPGIIIQPVLPTAIEHELRVGEETKLQIRAGTDVESSLGVVLRPDSASVRYPFQPGRELPSAGFGATLKRELGEPWRIGKATGTRVEVKGVTASFDADSRKGELDIRLAIQGHQAQLILRGEEQDGLLSRLLDGRDLTLPIPIGVEWSLRRGIGLRAGLKDLTIPVSIEFGPFSIDNVGLSVEAGDGVTAVTATADIGVALGPFSLQVDGAGGRARLDTSTADENLGIGSLALSFVPPSGVGVEIESDFVQGGGYLSYDSDNESYAGAMHAVVSSISVGAAGLLETGPFDGGGYSLLISVGAGFPDIPLGFGFSLRGLGGVLGLHRTTDVDSLRAGLRVGALESALFPAAPQAEMHATVRALATVFPRRTNRHLFGPVARLAWGPAALVTADLGLILELPDPIRLLLLGVIRAELPKPDRALVKLRLEVLGELDFAGKRLSLDGWLRDSKVASFPIEGEMALRLAWGDDPAFALSIGGFHPDFRPPPGFPQLKRITVPIGLDDNPRVTLSGYLALTSNTLQVGAAADLYASAGWFNITGSVDFNALFQFSPFAFVADFSGRLSLRKGDTNIATVSLHATISGPSPWHAAGEACLEIRWLPDICVGFSASFGRERRESVPAVDPWPVLREAAEATENYSQTTPPTAHRSATRASHSSARGKLEPDAGLVFRESAVPLGRLLTKFGPAKPAGGPVRFDVEEVSLGGDTVDWSMVTDRFAPAQFEELSDAEKLSRPSFEKMGAGVAVGADALAHGGGLSRPVKLETVIIDSQFPPQIGRPHVPAFEVTVTSVATGSAANSPLRTSGPEKFQGSAHSAAPVALASDAYLVVSAVDLSVRVDVTDPTSKDMALSALAAHLEMHPEENRLLQVLSVDELEDVA